MLTKGVCLWPQIVATSNDMQITMNFTMGKD